jgi:hypothetical protein
VAVEAALKAAGANETAVKLMLKEIDLSTVELDGNTVKNADKVIEPIKTAYAGLFGTQQQQGVPPATPPKGTPTSKEAFLALSMVDRMRFANEHPSEAAEYLKK